MNDENTKRRKPGKRGLRPALRSLFGLRFVFSLFRVFVVPILTRTVRKPILSPQSPLSWVLLLAALGGCARTQTFRVVDAQSGKPLEGVWVSQGGVAGSGYTLKTDPSGMVQLRKSGSLFSFARPGYDETRVEMKGSLARLQRAADPQGTEVKRHGNLVQVLLWPRRPDAGPVAAAEALPRR